MSDLDALFGKATAEIERMLSTKTVVGDPITVGDSTLIPLVSVGFGFGAGAGISEGSEAKKGPGNGLGTGGGGGVKPVALIIIDAAGVRLEPIQGMAASLADKLADVAAKFAPGERSGGSG